MAGTGVTFEQLRRSFESGKFAPLYLFYGEEKFLMRELQDLLIEKALAPSERDFNLDVLYGPEVDVRNVLSICGGYPMMAERRVVIVREFDKLPDNRMFSTYAEHPNTNAVVVLVCGGKPNLGHHPYRALKQHATICDFKPLEARKLPGWIEERIQAGGREIEDRALLMLSESVGTGLENAAQEVEKVLTYVGERGTITADDVIHSSGHTREHNVFELQRVVGARRYEEAVLIAERLLQQSPNQTGEAMRMHFILSLFFTKLWKLAGARSRGESEAEMARSADLRPFVLREYLHALRNWQGSDLQHAFSALLAADFELKGGSSRDVRLIVMLMLHRIIGQHSVARAA